MKLPTIQQGQAGRLVHQDVRAPLVEANARSAAFNAIGDVVKGTAEAYGNYVKRESKRQIQEGTLGIQQRLVEAEQRYGSVQEFNPLDPVSAEDENLTSALQEAGITNLNQTIPAYRVKPELMAKAWDNAIDEYSQGISDPDMKASFIHEQKTARMGKYLRDSVQASKDQIKYQATQTQRAVEQSLQNKDYGSAKLAILESELTEDEKLVHMKVVAKAEQVDTFSGVLKQRNPDAMQVALDELLDENSPSSSELTEPEEKVFANQLRTAIKQENTKNAGTAKGVLALVKDDASNMITELNGGGSVDPIQFSDTLNVMVSTDPVKARDMVSAMRNSEKIAEVNQMSITDMRRAKTTPDKVHATAQEAEDAAVVDKRIDQNMQAIKNDTIGFMMDNHVAGVVPVDFGSLDNFAKTLKLRAGTYDTAQEMYGYSSGYLSTQELIQADDMLSRATDPTQRIAIFSAISQSLGPKAGVFYEQLKNNGVGGADMLAGQMVGEGNVQDAITVVQGSQLLKSDIGKELITSDTKSFIKDSVVSEFGNAFAGNTVQRSLMIDAVTSAYAKLSEKASDFGSTDSTRMKQAIKLATGGLIEYNGSMLQSPTKDMGEGDFEDWVNTIGQDTFSRMNVLQSPEEVRDNISSGDWKLRGVGRGVYNVMDGQGNVIGDKQNASVPFKLVYDPTDTPTFNRPTQAQLDTIRKGNQYEKQLFSPVGIPNGIKRLLGMED